MTQIIYFANFSSKQEYLDTAISILCVRKAVISTQSGDTKAKVVNFFMILVMAIGFSGATTPVARLDRLLPVLLPYASPVFRSIAVVISAGSQ